MRIFTNYKQALNEIERDLREMGTVVHPATVQNKDVANDPNFDTYELQNYIYCVTQPRIGDLSPTQPWADAEWQERLRGIHGFPVNPGVAWNFRDDVWKEFLNADGEFDYVYSERLSAFDPVGRVISRLRADSDSRQLYISVWYPEDIKYIGGERRVPCTLGYLVQVRRGEVDITYIQRSADFVTHFHNDLFMCRKLQEYIAEAVGKPAGHFTHWIGSLHVFKKDVAGVF